MRHGISTGLAATAGVIAATAVPAQPVTVAGLMQEMAAALGQASSISVKVEKTSDIVLAEGIKVQYAGAADIDIRRPDRVHMVLGDDRGLAEIWYDGSTLTRVDHRAGVFGQVAAPPGIDETLAALQEAYGLYLPLAGLFAEDAFDRYAGAVEDQVLVGLHDVSGVPSHHLLLLGATMNWQIWIRDEAPRLPMKIVVTYTAIPSSPQDVYLFEAWDLDADLPDAVFVAKLDPGLARADFLRIGGDGQ